MKIIAKLIVIFSFISVQAQLTLVSHYDGGEILDGDVVTVKYDFTVNDPNAELYVDLTSQNNNDIRFQVISTDQGVNAENYFCTDFGLCYPPSIIDQTVELWDDNTRQLQLHYQPKGHPEDVLITYRVTEPSTSNEIVFSVAFIASLQSISTKDNVINKLRAYPNPANQFSKIEYEINEDSRLILYNILGEELQGFEINRGSGVKVIDTSKLQSGTYIYKIISQTKKVKTKNLIVNH